MQIDHSRIYRTRDLLIRYGVTPVTLWRWRRAGKIPEPQKLNDQNYWQAEQVAEADRRILGARKPEHSPSAAGGDQL